MTVLMPENWFIAIIPMPSSEARLSGASPHSRRSAPLQPAVPASAVSDASIAAISASASAGSPHTRRTIASASARRPFIASQRGDSGSRNVTPTSIKSAGTAATPIAMRQPLGTFTTSALMTPASSCPSTMLRSLSVTTIPLCSGGDSSATYSGTVPLAKPMAMPSRIRPQMKLS